MHELHDLPATLSIGGLSEKILCSLDAVETWGRSKSGNGIANLGFKNQVSDVQCAMVYLLEIFC